MLRRAIALGALMLLGAGPAAAQYGAPAPDAGPPVGVPLPPLPPPSGAPAGDVGPAAAPSSVPPPGASGGGVAPPREPPQPGPEVGRVFCEQQVAFRLSSDAGIPPDYRRFVGIWSDAAWTPQLCAALIVQGVQPDGTASIVYAYGPMGASGRNQGGVLRGTGIIREGELRFQNNDGSQFAFKPYFADLNGHLTTANGQNFEAIFKKTY